MQNRISAILERVQRRELQVDVAAQEIDDVYTGAADALPEDAIGQAVTGPVEGMGTTYNAGAIGQARDNGEGLPLSADQQAALEADDGAELTQTLRDAGYEVVEGADAVSEAIAEMGGDRSPETMDAAIEAAGLGEESGA